MTVQQDEGRKAHADGKSRRDNPYEVNSTDWSYWMDGFDQATSDATNHPTKRSTEQ
jgi:ribosome modulation factor